MDELTAVDTEIVELMIGTTKELTEQILVQNDRILAMNERILTVLLSPMVRITPAKEAR